MKFLLPALTLTALLGGASLFPAGAQENENKATPAARIKAAKGFAVELLYSVPAAEHGSWVSLCTDDKGRIYAGDQYGGIYRFAPPAAGKPLDPATIQKVPAAIKAADGMLWAFGALWVGVNDYENAANCGLYRVTDSDGDDQLDKVEKIRGMEARGDHGVHAVVLAPDGKSIFLVCGNGAKATETNTSSVPRVWGEDHLLPRMPDGRGFMRDVLGPGGTIYRISPDGQVWDRYATGFRNIYDAAFNRDGELFTYDADMEYDFNTPWYRPTRVCHVVSGAEYGWRNGAGKRPEWYPDNLPPVFNIGPGSPTGVTFGYGAKFPAKYQDAMFILDWSWGKIYALQIQPRGSSYTAVKEEFLSGTPLPVTDAIIHPQDGAMYFAIGGRKVQSGLYRVTYTGSESTEDEGPKFAQQAEQRRTDVRGKYWRAEDDHRTLRRYLEAFHSTKELPKIEIVWNAVGAEDRFLRWAARTALEHQPLNRWAEKALTEKDPAIQVEALLALARVAGIDPLHRQPSDPPVDAAMGAKLFSALGNLDWDKLSEEQRLTLVRTIEIVCVRFGAPDAVQTQRLIAQLDPHFPAPTRELNWLLCETLAFLQAPNTAAKAVALIERAPTQEEQMEYARDIRFLKAGWTTELHTRYFAWFEKAASYRGGASFDKFIEFIRNDAVASLTDGEKTALAEVLAKKPERKSAIEAAASVLAGRTPTAWTLDQLAAAAATGMKGRSFESGRKMFAAAACFTCHRFGNEGGMTGPDLTGAGGRYSPRDFLDQIINPSKEINEQFVPTVLTKVDGTEIIGSIVNLNNKNVTVNTDPSDPWQRVDVDRAKVKSIEPSKVSLMPPGLLNMLTKEEVLDLVAYVLSGGDPKNAVFAK